MMTEEQLDEFRLNATPIRVIRDSEAINDVKGIVVAWDEEQVAIRKQNRKIVKLSRCYRYQPFEQER